MWESAVSKSTLKAVLHFSKFSCGTKHQQTSRKKCYTVFGADLWALVLHITVISSKKLLWVAGFCQSGADWLCPLYIWHSLNWEIAFFSIFYYNFKHIFKSFNLFSLFCHSCPFIHKIWLYVAISQLQFTIILSVLIY